MTTSHPQIAPATANDTKLSLEIGCSTELLEPQVPDTPATCTEPELVVRVFTDSAELEQLREIWSAWNMHPACDFDFYSMILAIRKEVIRPHVITIYRDGQLDALLIGRLEDASDTLSVGYLTLMRRRVRQITFLNGGLLGNGCSSNCGLFVASIVKSLENGEADVALFEALRQDSSMRKCALKMPGLFTRDHIRRLRPHWCMSTLSSQQLLRKASEGNRKRFRRLLSAPNVTFTTVRHLEQVIESFGILERIASTTYQRGLHKGFADNEEHRQRLILEAQRGWLRLYILSIDNTPCAFLAGSSYRGIFHGAFTGYDASFKHLSPGAYLLHLALTSLYGDGIKKVDFGCGDAWYKQRLGDEIWQEESVRIFAPTIKGLILSGTHLSTKVIERIAETIIIRARLLSKAKSIWRQHLRTSFRESDKNELNS